MKLPPPRASGTIQSYMIEDDAGGLARSVPIGDVAKEGRRMRGSRTTKARPTGPRRSGPPPRDEPKLAVTHYRVLGAGRGCTLIQLRLGTGRKNQIRVHMKEWGRPIVGDHRYGAKTDPVRRLCLHAVELGFRHPVTGEAVRFQSPPPPGFFGLVGMPPPAREDATRADAGAPSGRVGRTPAGPVTASPAARTSWDHVAEWYDELIDERRSDLYDAVIAPGALRLLSPRPGMRVLDAACGQGDLCRRLAALGVEAVGVDASPRLIEAARGRGAPPGGPTIRYDVGDARSLDDAPLGLEPGSFDATTCVMALMNINPLEPVCRGVARLLKPGGALVAVILHPAFRAPGQTSWGWDAERGAETTRRRDEESHDRGAPRQFRRVDGYLSPGQRAIVMNPGEAAGGGAPVTTVTFHRPIQSYIAALSDAGLRVAALEEWASPRLSRPGPRAAEENRARREIPMFLAFRAVKAATESPAP